MTIQTMLRFADITPETSHAHPDQDRRLRGNPLRTSHEYFANDVHGVRSGTWSAEAGAYRIALDENKHEFFHLLSGKVQISNEDGSTTLSYGPGDTGIIPPGFKGVFDIVEPASKFWVVTERR